MNRLLVSCKDIEYKVKNQIVLERINLDIFKGDTITIIGPNGAGKSTLSKIIIGMIAPSSGSVKRKARIKIGYMPQKVHINHLVPITVKQFLYLNVRQDSELNENVDLIINENHLNSILYKQVHGISAGEWQRLLLARTLLQNPDLLILDEPTQGLDVNGQRDFYSLISKLSANKNKTILMISHDLYNVMSSSNRVICLNKHICCSGLPEAIALDKSYQSLFGVKSKKILSPYIHHHKQ